MRNKLRYVMALLLAVMVGLTVAQSRQGGGGFGGTGPNQLVNSKTVLADIKATEEQVTKLKEWAKEYQGKQMEFFKGIKEMSKEERTEKQAALTADAWKGIGKVLKEDQVKRLKQIELQVAGTGAYFRPDVIEALKITDDQKGKLQESLGGMFKDVQALREEFGLKGFGTKLEADKQEEYDKKFAKLNKEAMSAVQDVMTDDQKKKWKEMTGDPIDVPKVQAETRPNFGKKKD